MKKGPIGWIAIILLVIGGLNWGLYGAFNFDLVAWIFGTLSVVSRIVYILVGLAAIYKIVMFFAKKSGDAPAPAAPQV